MVRKYIHLFHLKNPFPVEELKPQYDWLICYEPEDHLNDMVEKIIRLPGIDRNSRFGAYSFKDDSTLQRLQQKGYGNTWRVHPQEDLSISDPCASVETYHVFFTKDKAELIKKKRGESNSSHTRPTPNQQRGCDCCV